MLNLLQRKTKHTSLNDSNSVVLSDC